MLAPALVDMTVAGIPGVAANAAAVGAAAVDGCSADVVVVGKPGVAVGAAKEVVAFRAEATPMAPPVTSRADIDHSVGIVCLEMTFTGNTASV